MYPNQQFDDGHEASNVRASSCTCLHVQALIVEADVPLLGSNVL